MKQYELRPYQQEAVEKGLEVIRKKQSGILVLPTGSGKSLVLTSIALQLEGKTIIFQPTKEILEQNLEKVKSYGFTDVGVFSASMNEKTVGKITFATIGTIYNKPEMWDMFDTCIVDESQAVNPKEGMYSEFLAAHGNTVLGLTATPYRMHSFNDYKTGDKTVVAKFLTRTKPKSFDYIAHETSIQEMVKDNYWCPLEYIVNDRYSVKDIKLNSTGMDFDEKSLKEYNAQMGVMDIIKDVIKNHDRKHILVFNRFVPEAEVLSYKLRESGISSAIVSADTPAKERAEIIAKFKQGEIRVVTNVGVLGVGFDFPELDCVIMGRPTQSILVYYQCLGRAVRPHPNKKSALIVDVCGNMKRFGRIESFEIVPNKDNGLPRLRSETGYLTGVDYLSGRDLETTNYEPVEMKSSYMPFGKFKGVELPKIPTWYIKWGAENLKGSLQEKFLSEIDRRNKVNPGF